MRIEPLGERREAIASDSVHPSAAFRHRDHELRRLQQLQMLHDRRARNRQTRRELAGRARRASDALKDDHADRMTEQREQPQHLAQLRGIGVRFAIRQVSGPTNTFDKRRRRLLYSKRARQGSGR